MLSVSMLKTNRADESTPLVFRSRNVQELAHMPISRLLWKFFPPAFAGVVVMSLYNIVDRIFIGQGVGSLALAGLSAVFPIMLLQNAFGLMLGIGGSVRASIALGEGNLAKAERVLGTDFLLMIVVGVTFSVVAFLLRDWMLGLFGITDVTFGYARSYLNIILLGSVFTIVGFSVNNFIRAEGNLRIAMTSMFISAGVNTVLDYLFIFPFGWGVAGAAWATVLSQVVLTVWVVAHFSSRRSVLKLRWAYVRFNWPITLSIITVGFSAFANQLAGSVMQSVYNVQLVTYGSDYAMSAIGIINSIAQLLGMSVVALNQSAQPIYGYNWGAMAFKRVRKCLMLCFVSGISIGIFGEVLVQLFPAAIIRMFDAKDVNLLHVGVQGLRIFFLLFPLASIQIVSAGYFQGVGKAGYAAIVALVRQVVFLIPLLLIIPRFYGLGGVWFSTPISDFCATILCLSLLYVEYRRLNEKIALVGLAG